MTEQQPQQSAEERKQPLRMQKGKQYQYISLFEETNKRGFAKKKKKRKLQPLTEEGPSSLSICEQRCVRGW